MRRRLAEAAVYLAGLGVGALLVWLAHAPVVLVG